MQSRFRKPPRVGFSHPFEGVSKSISTSQGRYTFYAITICGILGLVLHQPVIRLVQMLNPTAPASNAADLGMMITIVSMCALLVVSLLKMRTVMEFIDNRRLEAFNRRMQKRREADSLENSSSGKKQ
jgi:heme exporter protein D